MHGRRINRDDISPSIQNAFHDIETDWKSIGVMALQGFSKTSGVLVTLVFHANHRQNSYPGVATEVEEDHSLAFAQLSSR